MFNNGLVADGKPLEVRLKQWLCKFNNGIIKDGSIVVNVAWSNPVYCNNDVDISGMHDDLNEYYNMVNYWCLFKSSSL